MTRGGGASRPLAAESLDRLESASCAETTWRGLTSIFTTSSRHRGGRTAPKLSASRAPALPQRRAQRSRNRLEPLSCEVAVERERPLDPLPAHHLEAHPVDERHAAARGRQQRCLCGSVDLLADPGRGDGGKDLLDQEPDVSAAQPALNESDRLEDDVVVGEKRVDRAGEVAGCRRVALFVGVEQREQRRGVDEDGQRRQASSR